VPNIQVPAPLVGQRDDFSCGSAATMSCLLYWLGSKAPEQGESALWGALSMDPETGTEPEDIAKVSQGFGLDALPLLDLTVDDLRDCLALGMTVILCLQAWRDRKVRYLVDYIDAHYVVLVGMDETFAYVMDPWLDSSYGSIPLDQLDIRWHNPDETGMPQEHMGILIRGKTPAIVAPPAPVEPVL
jgi:predicted double-glycine peptidase